MSHTPKPWYDDGYRIREANTERVIVEYKHVDDFNYADALLIEAAPDMLEACIAAYEYLGELSTGLDEYIKLGKAIEKAKGKIK